MKKTKKQKQQKLFLSYTEWRKHFTKQRLRAYTPKYWHTKYEAYKAKKILGNYLTEAQKQGHEQPKRAKDILERLEKAGEGTTEAEQYQKEKKQLEYLLQDRFYKRLTHGLTDKEMSDWLELSEYHELLDELVQYVTRASEAYVVLENYKEKNAGVVGAYSGGDMSELAAMIADDYIGMNRRYDEYADAMSDEMKRGMSF